MNNSHNGACKCFFNNVQNWFHLHVMVTHNFILGTTTVEEALFGTFTLPLTQNDKVDTTTLNFVEIEIEVI